MTGSTWVRHYKYHLPLAGLQDRPSYSKHLQIHRLFTPPVLLIVCEVFPSNDFQFRASPPPVALILPPFDAFTLFPTQVKLAPTLADIAACPKFLKVFFLALRVLSSVPTLPTRLARPRRH